MIPIAALASVPANAEPLVFTEMGVISSTSSNYVTPDRTVSLPNYNGLILWFHFYYGGTAGVSSYLDIDSSTVGMSPSSSSAVDTQFGLFDASGTLLAEDDDGGQDLYSMLSFGSTTARAYNVGGGIGGLTAIPGEKGPLGPGFYWLAMGEYPTVFSSGWKAAVQSNGEGRGQPGGVDVNFRTDVTAVPEPGSVVLLGTALAALAITRRARCA